MMMKIIGNWKVMILKIKMCTWENKPRMLVEKSRVECTSMTVRELVFGTARYLD